MAPGGFSILAPFLGMRNKSSKKYEKLETEDPEKAKLRRQEATQEEIQRLNYKIVSYLSPRLEGFIGVDILQRATSHGYIYAAASQPERKWAVINAWRRSGRIFLLAGCPLAAAVPARSYYSTSPLSVGRRDVISKPLCKCLHS